MDRTDIAVIGAGITGGSIALHLAEETDRRVTVFERGSVAGETTAKSAAFFGYYGTAVTRGMKRYGMSRYNGFFANPRTDLYFDLVGQLRVATTPSGARALDDRAEEAADDPPLVKYIPGSDLPGWLLLPTMDTAAVEGALYQPHVGYLTPRELALEFIARARERDVDIETDASVERIRVGEDRVTGIDVDGGTVEVDTVICAAGPWNPALLDSAGVDLPVTHSLAPILLLDAGVTTHTLPIITHAESGVYLRGHRDGTVMVGHHPRERPDSRIDPDSVTDTVPADLRTEMWRVIDDLLPPLADADPLDEWVGVRSHTPDGHPIVGWTPIEGLSVAAFASSGIQLAPAVGHMIAQQVVHGRPTADHDALALSRFAAEPG